jgi:4-amino-4-deoxy-L-arabinose transferase-like glycosyltransferase
MKKATPYLYLSLIFGVAICLIHPTENFPLNDDWSYARVVKIWMDTGEIDFGDWPAMTLLAHAWWGKLFCSVFGFSHFVLRCSTLVLALFSGWLIYFLSLKMHIDRKTAFATALIIMFNPLFFWLSNTFMTDLPFLFSILLCILCSERFIETEKWFWLAALVLASVYSLLIRQFALVLPLALGVLGVVQFIKRKYKFAMLSVVPLVICALAFQWFCQWHKLHSPANTSFVSSSLLSKITAGTFLQQLCDRISELSFAMGLFLFPFLIILLLKILSRLDLKTVLWMIIPATVLFFAISFGRYNFPLGNIMKSWGTGPETLFDVMVLGINLYHVSAPACEKIIAVLSRIGMIILVINVSYGIVAGVQKKLSLSPFKLFLFLVFLCYFIFMSVSESYFDRYLIPLITISALCICSWPASKTARILVAAYTVLCAAYSLVGTRDYFEWNRTRYQLVEQTLKSGVDAETFNGGFEYMADRYYHYEFWWAVWMDNKKGYYITFGDMPGYKKETYLTYQRLLPFKKDTLFLVKKIEADSSKAN